MREGLLSQEEAVERVGSQAINQVNALNCEYTNAQQNDGTIEFSSNIECMENREPVILTAYYYQDETLVEQVEELDNLDWEIAGYTIEI
ncbi:TPA: hypothetical protein OO086_002512 [Legionella pneumophila]|nr:hypothetical protein [Legionella pneumophila]